MALMLAWLLLCTSLAFNKTVSACITASLRLSKRPVTLMSAMLLLATILPPSLMKVCASMSKPLLLTMVDALLSKTVLIVRVCPFMADRVALSDCVKDLAVMAKVLLAAICPFWLLTLLLAFTSMWAAMTLPWVLLTLPAVTVRSLPAKIRPLSVMSLPLPLPLLLKSPRIFKFILPCLATNMLLLWLKLSALMLMSSCDCILPPLWVMVLVTISKPWLDQTVAWVLFKVTLLKFTLLAYTVAWFWLVMLFWAVSVKASALMVASSLWMSWPLMVAVPWVAAITPLDWLCNCPLMSSVKLPFTVPIWPALLLVSVAAVMWLWLSLLIWPAALSMFWALRFNVVLALMLPPALFTSLALRMLKLSALWITPFWFSILPVLAVMTACLA